MAAAALSYGQVIRLPHVFVLLSATWLSRLAERMFAIAIVFHALASFHSPAVAGWIAFAAVMPGLVISPLAGALLDRAGAVRGILADLGCSSALALVLAGIIHVGCATPVVVTALAAVYALSSPLSAAGIRALLPRLVPPQAFDRANALDTAVHAVVDLAGPACAGALMGFAGPITTFVVIAACYAAATCCLLRLWPLAPPSPATAGFLRQALDGLGFVVRRPVLHGLAVGYALNMVTWGVLWVAVPVVIANGLPSGGWQSRSGLLWGAIGVTGGIGALIAGRVGMVGREVPGMTLCMVLTALAIGAAAVHPGLRFLAIILLLAGLLAGPIDVCVLTLRQRRTDPAQLGRVLAVSMSLNLSGLPVGTVLGGTLVAWSPALALLGAALASFAGALALRALIPASDQTC